MKALKWGAVIDHVSSGGRASRVAHPPSNAGIYALFANRGMIARAAISAKQL